MTSIGKCSCGSDLFARCPSNPILTPEDLPYPAAAVFNPAAVQVGEETVLVARVEDRRGLSSLGVFRSRDGVTGWDIQAEPSLKPDPKRCPEEVWGVGDPRATWLAELGIWGLACVSYSRRGPQVCLFTTRDFRSFERVGPIIPPQDDGAALFPRRFAGQWALLHRPVALEQDSNIWISFSEDLKHWGDHTMEMESRRGAWWDAHCIGNGPPPLETPEGWLVLYYGFHQTPSGVLCRLGLALLDLEDPRKVLRRSEEWVFGPKETYERVGNTMNMVYPCGWIHDETSGNVRLYYGAADTCIGLATATLSDLLDFALGSPAP